MANSEIFLITQQPTSTRRVVVLTDAQIRSGYQFDAVTRYSTRDQYTPTTHAIPRGTRITDHVVRQPMRFSLVGILTPYHVVSPIRVLGNLITQSLAPVSAIRTEVAEGTSTAVETVNRKRSQVQELADNFTPLTIVGNSFQHPNMIITGINDTKTPDLGDAYQLTISFQQIKIAREVTQTAPLISTDLRKLGKSAVIFFDG